MLAPSRGKRINTQGLPPFYVFVIIASLIGALLAFANSLFSASILALIALSTIPTRQILMPAINAASDAKLKQRFLVLHGLSVVITLAHIVAVAFVIVDLATH